MSRKSRHAALWRAVQPSGNARWQMEPLEMRLLLHAHPMASGLPPQTPF